MKKYNLKVLYLASDRAYNKQCYKISILANDFTFIGNSMIFYEDEIVIAVYPTNVTIIESIDELES